MKKLSVMLIVSFMMIFVVMANAQQVTEERATKDECVAKVKEAVKMFKEAGLEATLEKMNNIKGPFVWKDSYVYCFEDKTGKILAHKNAAIIGFIAKDLRDVNGKPYFREIFHIVNTKGEGFITYMYARTPGGSPESKTSYVYKIPDTNLIMGAGYFE